MEAAAAVEPHGQEPHGQEQAGDELVVSDAATSEAEATELALRIEYSEKYMDDKFEYRHVILPKKLAEPLPKTRPLQENEWRGIGVQQSRGWVHYAIHKPEPHILLFRRPLGTNPTSGKVDPVLAREAHDKYEKDFE